MESKSTHVTSAFALAGAKVRDELLEIESALNKIHSRIERQDKSLTDREKKIRRERGHVTAVKKLLEEPKNSAK
ncbi:MAG: hypothetical protein NUV67_03140 [archaeon]|nr:hypothetical protein [archaeon]